MTTAEFIIGHSADDAAERTKEARKILWALLAALGIHLLIGYTLAVFGGLLYSPFSVIEEDKPVELTFVDLATPAPAKNAMFIPNDESKQTEQPKEKTFESNANSIAASEIPPTGSMPCRRSRESIGICSIWICIGNRCRMKAPNPSRAWRSNPPRRNRARSRRRFQGRKSLQC